MTLTGRQFTIKAGQYDATVTEVGAALRRYRCAGVDVTCTFPEDVLPPKACGATLMPWPNRIRAGRYVFDGAPQQLALTEPSLGNAIHGLARWARWTRARQSEEAVTLRLDVVPQTGYPFELRLEVTFALDAEGGLTVTQAARNTGRTKAPFGAGAHPYLSTRGVPLAQTTVRVPAADVLVTDDRQIPTGVHPVSGTPHDLRRGRRLHDLRLDDGFTALTVREGRGSAEVRNRAGGARLWFDAAYRYLQVFTLDSLINGQPGIAMEPMTCPPDAFNSGDGLLVLLPGERWSASWGITAL